MEIIPSVEDFEALRQTAVQIIRNAERDLMIWKPALEQVEKRIAELTAMKDEPKVSA